MKKTLVIHCSGEAICKVGKITQPQKELKKCLAGRKAHSGYCNIIRQNIYIKEDYSYAH